MSIESKTSHFFSTEQFPLSNPLEIREPTTDERIQQLIKENKLLRKEIKALKNIIKNTNN